MIHSERLNLTALDSVTGAYPTDGMAYASAQITVDDESTIGTARIDIEWSLDKENWVAFDTAVQLATSAMGKRKFDVTGAGYIRARVGDEDDAADPNALIYLTLVERTDSDG